MKRDGSRRVTGKLVRWILLPVAGLVILGFLGSNLVMRSGWFRDRLAGTLTGKTGLRWTVAEASWSPWGGGRLGRVKAEASYSGQGTLAPVCEIEEIRVQPYWGGLLSGRLALRELRLKSPRGDVPVELLAELMASRRRGTGTVDVAQVQSPGNPGADPGAGKDTGETDPSPGEAASKDSGENKTPESDPGAKAGGTGATPGKGRDGPTPPAPAKIEQAGRLIVEDGELRIYSLSNPDQALVLTGLRADVPFSGDEAAGWLEMTGVRLGASQLVDGLKIPVTWQKPVLRLAPVEMAWGGLKFRALGALRIRGRLTGSAELRGFPGKLDKLHVPGWPSMTVSAGQVEMLARWQGDLARPGTWTGNLVGVVQGLQGKHVDRGNALVFDEGRVVADLREGVVQVPDARLMGERLSFMGNGLALMDGRTVAVLRIVADPEYAQRATDVAIGSMISRGHTSSWLAPLETPDRYFRDIHLQGGFPSYLVDVGRRREQIDLLQTVQWMIAFVKREQQEEHRDGLAHPGDREPAKGPSKEDPGS